VGPQKIGQQTDRREPERSGEDQTSDSPIRRWCLATRGLEFCECNDRHPRKSFFSDCGAISIALHASITGSSFGELIGELAMFQERAVRALLLPMMEDVFPECFEGSVCHFSELEFARQVFGQREVVAALVAFVQNVKITPG
jgi:hypothetical protein